MPYLLPTLREVNSPWVGLGVSAIGAAFFVLLLTPLVIRWARHKGWVDTPSKDRWHKRPTALTGGIALFLGVGGALALSGGFSAFPWPVWSGAALMFACGLADDLWGVRPEAKVLVQVVAAVFLLYAGHAFWRGGPAWVSLPLTFLWVIGVTNAFNLIDGIDGLAASLASVAAGALAFMSAVLGMGGLAAVMAALSGASLGFLRYNRPPARIFMGDCGSLLIGYLLAVGALGVQGSGSPVVGTLVPIAMLAVPLFDTTFVTITRLLRGEAVTDGGTDHVHHRLIYLGFSEREAVVALCGASATFAGVAIAALWMATALTIAVAILSAVGVGVVGVYLATVGEEMLPPELSHKDSVSERFGAFMRLFAGGASWKSVAGVLADLLVVGAAFVVAVHLCHSGAEAAAWTGALGGVLPSLIGLKLTVFYAFGLYEGIWRYAGTPEVARLCLASLVASLLVGAGLGIVGAAGPEAPSVLVIDWCVATIGIGGTRFGFRALRQYAAARRGGGTRVLLYGSGAEGLLALRYLRQHFGLGRTVVGLLDGDPGRHGWRVQGVEVLGGLEDLSRLAEAHDVDEVVVPVQTTSRVRRERLQARCAPLDVSCQYFDVALRPASREERLVGAKRKEGLEVPASQGDGHGASSVERS